MKTIEELEERMKLAWNQGDHIGWSHLWWVRRAMERDEEKAYVHRALKQGWGS